jgi:hypothetical protein
MINCSSIAHDVGLPQQIKSDNQLGSSMIRGDMTGAFDGDEDSNNVPHNSR